MSDFDFLYSPKLTAAIVPGRPEYVSLTEKVRDRLSEEGEAIRDTFSETEDPQFLFIIGGSKLTTKKLLEGKHGFGFVFSHGFDGLPEENYCVIETEDYSVENIFKMIYAVVPMVIYPGLICLDERDVIEPLMGRKGIFIESEKPESVPGTKQLLLCIFAKPEIRLKTVQEYITAFRNLYPEDFDVSLAVIPSEKQEKTLLRAFYMKEKGVY